MTYRNVLQDNVHVEWPKCDAVAPLQVGSGDPRPCQAISAMYLSLAVTRESLNGCSVSCSLNNKADIVDVAAFIPLTETCKDELEA